MPEYLYEGMFLLDSNKFAADPEGTSDQVLGILQDAGATVVVNREWQDGRLAYAIQGRNRALHYLTYFRMNGSRFPKIDRACKLSDVVLRYLVIRHPKSLFDGLVALSGEDHIEPKTDEKSASN